MKEKMRTRNKFGKDCPVAFTPHLLKEKEQGEKVWNGNEHTRESLENIEPVPCFLLMTHDENPEADDGKDKDERARTPGGIAKWMGDGKGLQLNNNSI